MQDVNLQNSMQAAFAPYNAIEHALKRAKDHKLPMSVTRLFELDEVNKVCRDKQQVRDICVAFHAKGQVQKLELTEDQRTGKGPSRDWIGYIWNPDYKGDGYRPSTAVLIKKNQVPSKVVVKRPEHLHPIKQETVPEVIDPPKVIELVFQGMTIAIGRNEKTGNARIVIEG